jgi:DNA-directed RNA polymerase subunit H (RpoH/RPB5)
MTTVQRSNLDFSSLVNPFLSLFESGSDVDKKDWKDVAVTLGVMLCDRGFGVGQDFTESIIQATSNKTCQVFADEHKGRRVEVYFSYTHKFGIGDFRNVRLLIEREFDGDLEIVIVLEGQATHAAQKEAAMSGMNIAIFTANELHRPPTDHYLVPLHRAVPLDKEARTLQRLSCTKDQLPRIHKNGIICRWFGWKEGRIIEITRSFGGTVQDYRYWRHVVNVSHDF